MPSPRLSSKQRAEGTSLAIISAVAIQLPDLEASQDRDRMRAFYKQALYYMLAAMEDHCCLEMVDKIVAEVA